VAGAGRLALVSRLDEPMSVSGQCQVCGKERGAANVHRRCAHGAREAGRANSLLRLWSSSSCCRLRLCDARAERVRGAGLAPSSAAAGLQRCQRQPGRQRRGARSWGAAGRAGRRCRGATGALPRAPLCRGCACFFNKKVPTSRCVFSCCVSVCEVCVCISDAPNSAVHVGMSHAGVALLTRNHLTGCPVLTPLGCAVSSLQLHFTSCLDVVT